MSDKSAKRKTIKKPSVPYRTPSGRAVALVGRLSENIRNKVYEPLGKSMRTVGYSESISKTPKAIIESQSVQHLMTAIGLTPQNVLSMLYEDLRNKPGKRLGELTLASDIMKLRDKDTQENAVIPQINITVQKLENDPGTPASLKSIDFSVSDEGIKDIKDI